MSIVIDERAVLRSEIDNLFNMLIDYQYRFLDRFSYPDTDKLARAAYAVINEATHKLTEIGRDCAASELTPCKD